MDDDRLILVSDFDDTGNSLEASCTDTRPANRHVLPSPPSPFLIAVRSLFPSGFRRTSVLTNDTHVRRSQIFIRVSRSPLNFLVAFEIYIYIYR